MDLTVSESLQERLARILQDTAGPAGGPVARLCHRDPARERIRVLADSLSADVLPERALLLEALTARDLAGGVALGLATLLAGEMLAAVGVPPSRIAGFARGDEIGCVDLCRLLKLEGPAGGRGGHVRVSGHVPSVLLSEVAETLLAVGAMEGDASGEGGGGGGVLVEVRLDGAGVRRGPSAARCVGLEELGLGSLELDRAHGTVLQAPSETPGIRALGAGVVGPVDVMAAAVARGVLAAALERSLQALEPSGHDRGAPEASRMASREAASLAWYLQEPDAQQWDVHPVARMKADLDGARLLGWRAACALDAGSPEGGRLAAAARIVAAESAARAVARLETLIACGGPAAEAENLRAVAVLVSTAPYALAGTMSALAGSVLDG